MFHAKAKLNISRFCFFHQDCGTYNDSCGFGAYLIKQKEKTVRATDFTDFTLRAKDSTD